jgi:hypothetical protein
MTRIEYPSTIFKYAFDVRQQSFGVSVSVKNGRAYIDIPGMPEPIIVIEGFPVSISVESIEAGPSCPVYFRIDRFQHD